MNKAQLVDVYKKSWGKNLQAGSRAVIGRGGCRSIRRRRANCGTVQIVGFARSA